MRTKELFKFIRERHAIYERRLAGKPKPWTKDPILQSYRFCNVYRELDTVTIWIRENWREPYDRDPNLWFATVVARLINWPDSLEGIGESGEAVFHKGIVRWSPNSFVSLLDYRKQRGEKVFTGAYMIHAGPAQGASKAAYLAKEVLTPMWARRGELTNELLELNKNKSLARLHTWLMTNKDMGSFMAGQVVADVKFQSCWREASDWWSFAAPGPGSERGLARVIGEDPRYRWGRHTTKDWGEQLQKLQHAIDRLANTAGIPRISAQDLQNCLCEFDKHERVRLGEGRPRSLYPGKV